MLDELKDKKCVVCGTWVVWDGSKLPPACWVVSFQIARGLTKREPDVCNVTVGVGIGE